MRGGHLLMLALMGLLGMMPWSNATAELKENSKWECTTCEYVGCQSTRKGRCIAAERKLVNYNLISMQDMGVITGFLKAREAEELTEEIQALDKGEWTMIKNDDPQDSFNRDKRRLVPNSEYMTIDLQVEYYEEIRAKLAPHFELFAKEPKEQLMLYLGKYSKGSFESSHNDVKVFKLNGVTMHRKRGFALFLNQEWSEDNGGIMYDEEDGDRGHVPVFNSLLHHRVPRWHSMSPIKDKKSMLVVYGWTVEEKKTDLEMWARTIYSHPAAYMPILASLIFAVRLYFFPIELELPAWMAGAPANKGNDKKGGAAAKKAQ